MSEARYRSNIGIIVVFVLILYIASAMGGDPTIVP